MQTATSRTYQDHSVTGAGKTVAYSYDGLNRLTRASTTLASSTPYRHQFTYTMLGNITGFSTSTNATSTYGYEETNFANPQAVTGIKFPEEQPPPMRMTTMEM